MNFRFTNDFSLSKLDEIVDYLRGPRIWFPKICYPDYFDWLQKIHSEIKSEQKRALIALDHFELIGVIIYQKHKTDKDSLELKNLTVRPDKRGRHIASFLLKNAEVEGLSEFKSKHIVCDTKQDNMDVRLFLFKNNYKSKRIEDLYGLKSGLDVVYQKDINLMQK